MMTPRRRRLLGAIALAGACYAVSYAKYYSLTKPFPLNGSTPELFLQRAAADKFLKCGVWHAMLLPDYSVSRDCRERPVVYTHQPSGPALLLAAFRLLGMDFPGVRLPYVLAAFAGVAAFILFCEAVTGSIIAASAGALYLIASQGGFIQWSDNLEHALYWLVYFGSLFLFLRADEGKANLLGRLLLLFVGLDHTIMWSVSILAAQLSLALIMREDRLWTRLRQSLLLGGAFAALAILHNAAYLGWDVALKDAGYTLTNRIFAVPARSELAGFYKEHGIVLWGAEYAEPGLLSSALANGLRDLRDYALLLALFAAWRFPARGLRSAPFQLFAAAFGTLSWYCIFVSLGQHYTLPYLIRTAAALIIAGSAAEFVAWSLEISKRLPARFRGFALALMALIGADIYSAPIMDIAGFYYRLQGIGLPLDRPESFASLEALRAVPPEATLWTNIDPPLLMHYTEGVVVGSCTEEAFRARRIDRCFGTFYDQNSRTALRAAKPDFFFIDSNFIPGSMLCRGKCLKDLAKDLSTRFRLIGSDQENWWLFKLGK